MVSLVLGTLLGEDPSQNGWLVLLDFFILDGLLKHREKLEQNVLQNKVLWDMLVDHLGYHLVGVSKLQELSLLFEIDDDFVKELKEHPDSVTHLFCG